MRSACASERRHLHVQLTTDEQQQVVIGKLVPALHTWDNGVWTREPSSSYTLASGVISAMPTHFSRWAILISSATSTYRVYAPLVQHSARLLPAAMRDAIGARIGPTNAAPREVRLAISRICLETRSFKRCWLQIVGCNGIGCRLGDGKYMFDGIVTNALGQLIGEVLGESLEHKLDRRMMLRQVAAAVQRAEARFAREYAVQDSELAVVLTQQTHFADLPSVRRALRELLTHPFNDPSRAIAVVQQSFSDVLPERLDRARIDAAVQAFLLYLGEEVLYVPQLRETHALLFQKISAESNRHAAAQAEAYSCRASSTCAAICARLPQPALNGC